MLFLSRALWACSRVSSSAARHGSSLPCRSPHVRFLLLLRVFSHTALIWAGFLFLLLGRPLAFFFFFFNDPAPPEISPLPLHDALPISVILPRRESRPRMRRICWRTCRSPARRWSPIPNTRLSSQCSRARSTSRSCPAARCFCTSASKCEIGRAHV